MALVKLVEVCRASPYTSLESGGQLDKFTLREVFINPSHVVALREDEHMMRKHENGRLLDELDDRCAFTKVFVNRGQMGFDFTVVGSPAMVEQKLKPEQLLKG